MRGHAGWDEYWAGDRPQSCVPLNPQTAAQLRDLWLARFETLAAGARILDVATGNGILLAHAVEVARRRQVDFALTGVDLAAIDPLRHLSHPDPLLRHAQFIGGVAAERLPFTAAAFEMVVSQYGLEYAQPARALTEVARVLVPGGRLVWLAHHEDSDVVIQNAAQQAEVDWLLGAAGPYVAMRGFVRSLANPQRAARAASRLERALRDAEEYCRMRPPARVVTQVCTEFVAVAQRAAAYRRLDLERMLDDGEHQLRLHRQRIVDLRRAVLTGPRRQLVREALASRQWQDLRLTEARLAEGESPVGLWLEATRSPSA